MPYSNENTAILPNALKILYALCDLWRSEKSLNLTTQKHPIKQHTKIINPTIMIMPF